MTRRVIPLEGGSVNAHQEVTVQLGNFVLDITLNYQQSEQWTVDIDIDGIRKCSGLPIEVNADIIAIFRLGIGKLVFVGDDTTLDNLGVNNALIWVSEDDGQ